MFKQIVQIFSSAITRKKITSTLMAISIMSITISQAPSAQALSYKGVTFNIELKDSTLTINALAK